jgi:hypothetical protein
MTTGGFVDRLHGSSVPGHSGSTIRFVIRIITSTAERQAAVEFAKAAAMRPQIVGVTLQKIAQDSEISKTMFEILETQNIIDGKAEITLVPRHQKLLGDLIAGQESAVVHAGAEKVQ